MHTIIKSNKDVTKWIVVSIINGVANPVDDFEHTWRDAAQLCNYLNGGIGHEWCHTPVIRNINE